MFQIWNISSLRDIPRCSYKNTVAPHNLACDNDFGGGDDGYEAEGEMEQSCRGGSSYATVSQSRTSGEISTTRKLPQEEGTGYDVTATY